MLQRIQTIYLFLSFGLLCVFCCLPVFHLPDNSQLLKISPLQSFSGENKALDLVFIFTLLTGLISLLAIFLYHNRKAQRRLVRLNSILILLLILLVVYYGFSLKGSNQVVNFNLSFSDAFPILALVFNYLSASAIKRDQELVDSLNRLR